MSKFRYTNVGAAIITVIFSLSNIATAVEKADSVTTAVPMEKEQTNPVIDALIHGKPSLDMRLRYETADQEGLMSSDALTIRTRLGYRTKPLYGISAFIEMEDVRAIGTSDNYNQAGLNPGGAGKTIIADVEGTEVNQAYLAAEYLYGIRGVIGRQRIILDNARFIGNVGWRQNEQTYDAFSFKAKPLEQVEFFYAYLDTVRRIFGQENGSEPAGAAVNAAKFNSDSHIINLKIKPVDCATFVAYGYLLDLGKEKVGAANSSDTFGASLNLKHKLDNNVKFAGDFEYASQSDNSATTEGVSYRADYYKADVRSGYKAVLGGIGYEVLGSDDGVSFKTPLATGHKFNGWADKFLLTPADGLRDSYIYAQLTCPRTKSKLKVIYHDFESDINSISYGTETDILLIIPVTKEVKIVSKYASYNADSDPDNPIATDIERFSIEVNLIF